MRIIGTRRKKTPVGLGQTLDMFAELEAEEAEKAGKAENAENAVTAQQAVAVDAAKKSAAGAKRAPRQAAKAAQAITTGKAVNLSPAATTEATTMSASPVTPIPAATGHSPVKTAPPLLSVSALTLMVRQSLEENFPQVRVTGEISAFTRAASGHLYFSLKDADAQVRCVMWRGAAARLSADIFRSLKNGQAVEIRAVPSFYEARGEFQLTVESLSLAGLGALYEQFLRLKARLAAEGWFAAERKRPLPHHVRRIALVTSLQAAALRDVVTVLTRRAPHICLFLFAAPVQGEGAAERLAKAVTAAAQSGVDAVLLCRGGGSLEDLWAFNEEPLLHAIVHAAVPVVSGVGHENDITLADMVADVRAATPSAAAELLSADAMNARLLLTHTQRRLQQQIMRRLNDQQRRIDELARRLRHPAAVLRDQRRALEQSRARLRQSALWCFNRYQTKLNQLGESLRHANPLAILARGYALVTDKEGRILHRADESLCGQVLQVRLAQTELTARVETVRDSDGV